MPSSMNEEGNLEWGTKFVLHGPLYQDVAKLLATLELATTRVVINEQTEFLSLRDIPFSTCGFLPKRTLEEVEDSAKESFVTTAKIPVEEKVLEENMTNEVWLAEQKQHCLARRAAKDNFDPEF